MKLAMLLVLPLMIVSWVGFSPADVLITAGDFAPPDASVMLYERPGLLLTRPEAWVGAWASIPYPSELLASTALQVTVYFIPDSPDAGDVDFKLSINTHNAGDEYNTPPWAGITAPPPVPVAGSDTRIYSQTFDVTYLPTPRDLLGFSLGRDFYGTDPDTYQTGVYLHAIRIVDVSGAPVEDVPEGAETSSEQSSLRAFPNPFQGNVAIQYDLNRLTDVSIQIFDVNGRRVDAIDRGTQAPGRYEFSWDPPETATGVYFVKMMLDGEEATSKIVRLK